MHLLVISHKACWPHRDAQGGYATRGGFARQMEALAGLFERTTVLVPCHDASPYDAGSRIQGPGLEVVPLSPQAATPVARRLGFVRWVWRHRRVLREHIQQADVVHVPVPGDIGVLGILLARRARRRLFVRHCGDWRRTTYWSARWWRWGLRRLASETTPVFATGGDGQPPVARNAHVQWVFATSLWAAEIAALREARASDRPPGIRLVSVGRQRPGKGTRDTLRALAWLVREGMDVHLHVIGDGPSLGDDRAWAAAEGLDARVTFHGQIGREQVLDVLLRMDVMVHLTRAEGFPKAVLEALACGVPVVAPPVSALPGLLEEGAGAIVTSRHPSVVASAVRSLVADDRLRHAQQSAYDAASGLSLEAWRDAIGARLREAWGLERPDHG